MIDTCGTSIYRTISETYKHKNHVNNFMNMLIKELMNRAINHDNSKLESPELEIFDKNTAKLATCTYGSDEYKRYMQEMRPALTHHYENNSHHPEYHDNGIKDMTLVDLIEMICDWKAATLRHNDGDILKSIKINQERFNYSDEILCILTNTIRLIERIDSNVD
jgi:hypothetical protein